MEGTFIRDTYPDASIVYLVRDPLEVVPSAMHLMRTIWLRFGYYDRMAMQPLYNNILEEICSSCEQMAARCQRGWDGQDVMVVSYKALIDNALLTVNAIYRHLGITLAADAHHALSQACEQAKNYKPAQYTLEEFGVNAKEVAARTQLYRDCFNAYL